MSSQSKRKNPTQNQEQLFYAEVGGLCPLCGNKLMYKGTSKYVKQYEIAHIYPCNPTQKDLTALASVEKPLDTETYENKIALCLACHQIYDDDKTLERYNLLRDKKNKLLIEESIKGVIGIYPLEDDLREILYKLSTVSDTELSTLLLSTKALRIKEKIGSENLLLRHSIESNVAKYFIIVQRMLKELGTELFETIALQIKNFYKKCSNITQDKDIIFKQIVDWIKIKSKNDNKIACEIVTSFFVQNCEVFDEITE